ncbi:MAG TPA: pyridoxamine 5'-phosphate oxidase family protein [Blastocatellia bacterium]|nr:pyridoxamine 5'-phosphate oxidase family protein [Blastocatellia bacterium]
MSTFSPTGRTTLRRLPKRGDFERDAIFAILDEAFICHVGFIVDGKPVVIPTSFVRVADDVYIHGSAASRMLRSLEEGIDVCVTVTLIDGLVLARSAFHHSINYRSVVIFGKADAVDELEEKLRALHAFTEHVVPGRWADVRPPDENELRATLVLRLRLAEVSAKVRTGPPIDDDEDYNLAVWAGVLPLRLIADAPVVDDRVPAEIQAPDYLKRYSRNGKAG